MEDLDNRVGGRGFGPSKVRAGWYANDRGDRHEKRWSRRLRLGRLIVVLSRIGAAFAFAIVLGQEVQAAPCSGLTGVYVGHIKMPDEQLDAELNLFCDAGTYKAQFFTSQNDFQSEQVKGEKGHITIKYDDGVSAGVVNLENKIGSSDLTGTLSVGGQTIDFSLKRIGPATSATALLPTFDLTPAQWREDLHRLAVQLPKVHANAFYSLSRAEFDAEARALDQRIEKSNADEIYIGLKIITKSIGDGHTGIGDPPDRRVMPIQFGHFGKEFRVVAVGPGLDAALGKQLVKVGDLPIAEVWERVLRTTAQKELDDLRNGDGLVYLSRGYALHGLDVIPDRNFAVYTLEDDHGRQSEVRVQGLPEGRSVPMKTIYSDKLLRIKNADDPFWCQSIPGANSLYCGWHSYQGLSEKGAKLSEQIKRLRPEKLIIDMRDNGGGDNSVGYTSIVQPIKADTRLNSQGHLYVLVGPLTFSAAMNNAAQFQDETKAILVGETIGERPNSYQEPRQFHLPNSHLVIRASTRWYAFRPHGPNKVSPNKEIIPSWNDVTESRDPVLDWALKQPIPRSRD